ncbi:MAG: hypothetical protein FWG14_09395 [Peptococcaceae bacterium]|nr:hypothetical protein [Peptococcaceae bacterium]
MALTQERAEILTGILTADEERTKNLFALSMTEALIQINALGNDFTLEEFDEYNEVLKKCATTPQDELDAEALDDASGGFFILGAIAGGLVLGGVGGLGYVAGYWANKI